MKKSPLYPVIFIVALALFFGSLVSGIERYTREKVASGEVANLRGKVLYSLGIEPPADTTALATLWGERIREVEVDEDTYYRALALDGSPLGIAIPFIAPGFWGPVTGVLAVTPGGEELLGIAFISHQETPGLGGRISEGWFTEQFRGKRLTPKEAGGVILSFVYRETVAANEVEAITGATQTSSRLATFLQDFLSGIGEHPAFNAGEGAR